MPDQYTLEEFGKRIKAKYPQYANLSDTDIANKVLAKYPQYKSSIVPSIHPEARTVGNYLSEAARGVGRGVENDVSGLYQTIAHPINTATGMAKQLSVAQQAANKEYLDLKGQGGVTRNLASMLAFAENAPVVGGMVQRAEEGGSKPLSPESVGAGAEAATTFAAPELAGRGLAAVIPKVKGAPEGALRTVTGTTPKSMGDLVEETRTANEALSEKAAAKNAAQESKRNVDLRKHFEKTRDVQQENAAKEGQVSRKEALNRGVEQLDTQFQSDLGKLRESVHQQANAKYQALNEALDSKMTTPEFLPDALVEASEKIKGSDTEPTILKDMEKKVKLGDAISYRDLQGYYSELGRELTKGTLPGDVYAAFDALQDTVGQEMQRIADENGMGVQLKDARATWRQMKETFYDPKSPLTKALKAKERGGAIKALQGKDQTGVAALAKYDPELARRANTIRGHQAEAAALPKKATGLKSLPKLSEKPSSVVPETRTIGREEIQAEKGRNLQENADRVKNYTNRAALYVTTYRSLVAVGRAMAGDSAALGQLPADLAEGAAVIAGGHALARFLESPKIREMLTRATPADIAQIPPEMRGDLGSIVQEAQKQGIKVSPALINATTGAALAGQRKGVASALQP